MDKLPATSPIVVGVTQGTTQHAAFLMEQGSTTRKEWVDPALLEANLPPRRGRQSTELLLDSSPSSKRCKHSAELRGQNKSSYEADSRNDLIPPLSPCDNSDASVEILLTIQPPTHQQQSQQHLGKKKAPDGEHSNNGTVERSTACQVVVDLSESDSPLEDFTEILPASQYHTAGELPLSDARTLTFSYSSSAYVQNLAEICYTILQDRRWRVGNTMEPLFRWEAGDDMSAVTALSRQFHIPTKVGRWSLPCTCLLCVENKAVPQEESNHDESTNKYPQLSESVPVSATTAKDDECSRSLYLYCRLFYRKGPWFRLDDVYTRYYAPETVSTPAPELERGSDSPPLKENFFEPIRSRLKQSQREGLLEATLLQRHIKALENLFHDLHHLETSGLIRSFRGEEECGKAVGVRILSAEERGLILSKLGASKKNPNAGRRSQGQTHENRGNAVWRQMSQQRTITSLSSSGNGENALLPVQKFVDEVILEKLARAIVQGWIGSDYVRPHELRQHWCDVKTKVTNLCRTIFAPSGRFRSCFRLSESSSMTLQRCGRLHLCATCGPGEMRGDGTNGWKSLIEIEGSPPFAHLVPPPGVQTWHQTTFPGLSTRFGISTSCFMDSYEWLSVDDRPNHDYSLRSEQVFHSYNSFRAWEQAVDFRANVDYLVELNETIKYEARRADQGSSPKGPSGNGGGNDSIDFMKLLRADGRKAAFGALISVDGTLASSDTVWRQAETEIAAILPVLDNDCERILSVIGILATQVLADRNKTIVDEELVQISDRPWLRHMSWDAVMAYILWDIIPVFEKKGLYRLAVRALEALLFGHVQVETGTEPVLLETARLAPFLLSRRARGKGFDRLLIDFTHLNNNQKKAINSSKDTSGGFRVRLLDFCRRLVDQAVNSSFISFSTIRKLARRLRQPLADFLRSTSPSARCLEADELGLRLDWAAPVDTTIANSLGTNIGSRCSFVGFEDNVSSTAWRSWNVEELALEYYDSGRLPATGDSSVCAVRGGWKGWHDEGGHIRALFRILCSAPVLGMDWGCPKRSATEGATLQLRTIHLSPYQGAPFDLQVGFEARSGKDFYSRRQSTIKDFLIKLERLSGQQLADVVYDSIKARVVFMEAVKRKDPFVQRDVLQARTLSLIAVGCGGMQLAAIFRCLFFDYRHYSGGLPDLLLVRAIYLHPTPGASPLVELGDWVGESFSDEVRQRMEAELGAALLADKNDEFLGCSKVGDSSAGGSRNKRRAPPASGNKGRQSTPKIPSLAMMPERLVLEHNGQRVKAECMMVEVKSSNDRLDLRQEDWLNVLDKNGNARVCKFQDMSKSKAQKQLKDSAGGTNEEEFGKENVAER